MAGVWAIEDGQTFPLATFTGDDHPHPSAIAFSTGLDAHDMILTLRCEDGSSYALTFNRTGTPVGPAVKTEAPSGGTAAGASLHAHDAPAPSKKK